MEKEFRNLLERLRTPYKHDELILAPSFKRGKFDSHAVDCPFVFTHKGCFYMTYVGWDSFGYRTGLASSDDLIHWEKEGMVIDRGPKGSTTELNAGLTWIVRDNELFGNGHLKKVNGRFLGTCVSFPKSGYEGGPGAIGLCWSEDMWHWELDKPILLCRDGGDWEKGGLYKSCLVEYEGTYYMFYNAKNQDQWPWIEQTGVAISTDLKKWTRDKENPVLTVGSVGSFDDRFASDPCVLKCGDIWVMFYFGNCSDGHARDGIAFSRDLIHWQKSNEILINIGPQGTIDSRHACKPSIFFRNGKVYHFYNAVAPAIGKNTGEIEYNELKSKEIRGISFATS